MRKHLYRKSAWKEGVPSSLNYRSVLSGALYGFRHVGGPTAHSSLHRPSRHRLGWRFLTFTSSGRPRGRRAPPLLHLPRRTSRCQPGCGRGHGHRSLPGCNRSTCGSRLLTLTSRRLSRDGEPPHAQSRRTALSILPPSPPPDTSRDRRDT